MRFDEAEGRQAAMNLLGSSLVQVRKVLDLLSKEDEKYNHLTEEDRKKLADKDFEFQSVFHDFCSKTSNQVLHEDPAVTISQINAKRKEFEDHCSPIVNKPKPKVEPPPSEPVAEKKGDEVPMESSESATQPPPSSEEEKQSPSAPSETTAPPPSSMELD